MTPIASLIERLERGDIKALSIRQPYPHHILHDGKDVENRDWPTKGRGWVLMHAGKNDSEDRDLIREKKLPLGGIVGAIRISDCVERMDSSWFYGPYGFVIADKIELPFVACKGALGFFKPEAAVVAAVLAALKSMEARGEG